MCGFAVALAAVIVYLNAFGNEFVLDDTRIIRDNVRIRSLANVPGLFASPYWDLEGTNALYRPMVLASYAANYALHGVSTYGYTAVNIALHDPVRLIGKSSLFSVACVLLSGQVSCSGTRHSRLHAAWHGPKLERSLAPAQGIRPHCAGDVTE